MTTAAKWTCGLAVLMAAAGALWWRSTGPVAEPAARQPVAASTPLQPAQRRGPEPGAARAGWPAEGEQAWVRVRVRLPAPVNAPWKGGLFDSGSLDNHVHKGAAVEVLPLWIRNALAEGNADLAARYLWSLLQLIDDRDPETAVRATFAIYRLGDVNDRALTQMRRWIEDGWRHPHSEGGYGWSQYSDVRKFVLDELAYYRDGRLNDAIYARWQADLPAEEGILEKLDYGYFLENHVRRLPPDYWLSRLDHFHGVENTLAVLQSRRPAGFVNELQSFFTAHQGARTDSIYAERNVRFAAVLYNETRDETYLRYLLDAMKAGIAASLGMKRFSALLESLAVTNAQPSLDLLAGLLNNPKVGTDPVLAALGRSSNPRALQMVVAEAERQAAERFPKAALASLLAQRKPEADVAYQELKTALLSGRLGWLASTRDFEALEFFRKSR